MLTTIIKTVGGLVVGGSTGYIADCALKLVQPATMNLAQKVLFKMGTLVVGGIAVDMGTRYFGDMVDEVVSTVKVIQGNKKDIPEIDINTNEFVDVHGNKYILVEQNMMENGGVQNIYKPEESELAGSKYQQTLI